MTSEQRPMNDRDFSDPNPNSEYPEWYLRASGPRLKRLDAIQERCHWGSGTVDADGLRARAEWIRLLDEQNTDELLAGL